MKVDDELRLGERRAKFERRSGVDARPIEERERLGERRAGPDRRLGVDRRSKDTTASQRSLIVPIVAIAAGLWSFDVYFEGGRHTIQPTQILADKANADISAWVSGAFPKRY